MNQVRYCRALQGRHCSLPCLHTAPAAAQAAKLIQVAAWERCDDMAVKGLSISVRTSAHLSAPSLLSSCSHATPVKPCATGIIATMLQAIQGPLGQAACCSGGKVQGSHFGMKQMHGLRDDIKASQTAEEDTGRAQQLHCFTTPVYISMP